MPSAPSRRPLDSPRARQEANRRRLALVVSAFAGALAVVLVAAALLLGLGLPGVLAGVLLAVALTWGALRGSDAAVLWCTSPRPADLHSHARFRNLVEGLCVAAGVPVPRLFVLEDDGMNALVAGHRPQRSFLVATTGLLEGLSRIELEAVLAQLVVRIRGGEASVATAAVTLLAGPTLLADVAAGWGAGVGRLLSGALRPLEPLTTRLVGAALGTAADQRADTEAVALTRYPPALTAALDRLGALGTGVARASAATSQLWLAPPVAGRGWRHMALDERKAALKEL